MMTTQQQPRTTRTFDLTKIADASAILPWKVTPLPASPYRGMSAFNPCVHFDGDTWRCVLRCADYSMPNGVTTLPDGARPNARTTKNALLVLDPRTWKPIETHLVRELDGLPRNEACTNVGYEDMRIFLTDKGGLQGIAASLHLARPISTGRSVPPEQVIVSFDDRYNIVAAEPLRGTWSNVAQKNWMPFDGAEEARFLYSIDRGVVFDEQGPIGDLAANLAPLKNPRPENRGVTEVKMMRAPTIVSAGRAQPAGYSGIRGGSQLLHVGDDLWIGVGHEMRYQVGKKFYWHTFFLVDSSGAIVAKSQPMKLAPNGIEFAAGMAIAGDRLVISFGVDDAEAMIGETSLAAVRAQLVPISGEEAPEVPTSSSELVTLSEPKRPSAAYSRDRSAPQARLAAPNPMRAPRAPTRPPADPTPFPRAQVEGDVKVRAAVSVAKLPRGDSMDLVGLMRRVRDSALPGAWPPLDKMQGMALLVAALRPMVAVEIGVWTGDSLIPQLLAMKHVGQGHAIAIDPWAAAASVAGQTVANASWWGGVDHEEAHATFQRRLDAQGVRDRCTVVRSMSDSFAADNLNIDLCHVDGNHGEQAERDVARFAPSVRVGGILVLDDLGWEGGHVSKARDAARSMGFDDLYALGTGVVMLRRR